MIERIPELLLYAAIISSVVYHLPRRVGGWRGLLHPALREPAVAMLGAAAVCLMGVWLIRGTEGNSGTMNWGGMGILLVALAGVISLIALSFAGSAITDRRTAAAHIADELDRILDSTDTRFVVDASNAHRPLELLNELSQLIGPGHHAPGQPWATHQWIAERMPAALALKPDTAEPRIGKPMS